MTRVRYAPECICGKRMIFEDTCAWCGHGLCRMPLMRQAPRLRRLPWDLGAVQREGRHPDPNLENVVRLDRLRDRWKVPPVPLARVEPIRRAAVDVEACGLLSPCETQVVALYARGLSREAVAERMGVDTQAVSNYMAEAYRKLGIGAWQSNGGLGHKAARQAAVDWYLSQQCESSESRLAA